MEKGRFVNDKSIFLNSTLVAKVTKSNLEEIRILALKNNKIDMRIYVSSAEGGEPYPTRKGIWLSYKDIPAIIETLEKLASGTAKDLNLEIEQSEKIKTKVYTADFRGKSLVHIRTFYLQDNEFKPGKGISFQSSLTKEILDALKQTDKFKA